MDILHGKGLTVELANIVTRLKSLEKYNEEAKSRGVKIALNDFVHPQAVLEIMRASQCFEAVSVKKVRGGTVWLTLEWDDKERLPKAIAFLDALIATLP